MKRVLQSLEMATLASSGIPQDTRLLFKGLVSSGVHDVSGLVIENSALHTAFVQPRPAAPHATQIYDQSNYLLGLAEQDPPHRPGFPGSLHPRIQRLQRRYFAGTYKTLPFDRQMFGDSLWRLLFQRSLPAVDRGLLDRAELRYTNLTNADCIDAVLRPFAPEPKLDTSDYDVAIFPDVRMVGVSPRTVKLVRYHDTIPVSEPDLLGDGLYTTVHYLSLLRCAKDSYFVCNSEATRDSLVRLLPDIEPFAHVIPCALDLAITKGAHLVRVADVVQARRTHVALGDDHAPSGGVSHVGRYILMVAAIEPKKNIVTGVRAWERVRAEHPDLKLILVGNKGWAAEQTYAAMRPHVNSGELLHLQNVPFVELQALMLNAELLLFPSYAEGFGYPPMEAMALGTPSVVSDIAAHRSILGGLATFADPYSPQNLADRIGEVLAARAGAPRGEPTAAMMAHLAQFSLGRAADKWNALIEAAQPRQRS